MNPITRTPHPQEAIDTLVRQFLATEQTPLTPQQRDGLVKRSITLTPHQHAAVDWLVDRLRAGEKLLALRGLAGTGKTSVLPALQAALRAHGVPSVIGAPTHRAVMILRQKGLDAETVHRRAVVTYFAADYRRACAWLGEDMPVREGDPDVEPHPDVDGLPWLVYDAVKPDLERGKALTRQRRYPAARRLASIGISGREYVASSGPKAGQGVLIVDEASMVGKELLTICEQAYPQIVLVGDPGQLPPVKDTPVLWQVEGIDLTEIHRQAQDSPILRLAYQAREGQPFWLSLDRNPLNVGAPVRAIDEVSARRFLTSPLLVGFNDTREDCTHAIRQALGYPRAALQIGEPLVCRTIAKEDRAMGFFNNGLYTITEVSQADPRLVSVKDALGDVQTIRVHMEELDGKDVDPRAIPFRFGYAVTVHTAQGGEWPRVYISLPDLDRKITEARKYRRPDELKQWAYTAITRAKTHLRFLTQHTFSSPKERTPMATPKRESVQTEPAEPETGGFVEGEQPQLLRPTPTVEERLAATTPAVGMGWNITTPAPPAGAQPASPGEVAIFGADDITDPTVPLPLQEALERDKEAAPLPGAVFPPETPGAPPRGLPDRFGEHEAIFQAALAHLMQKFDAAVNASVKGLNKETDELHSFMYQQLQVQKEKAQQAETLLDTLTSKAVEHGIQLRHDPYLLVVGPTLSPQGIPVTIHAYKQHNGELVEELQHVVQWLARNGYKPA